MEYKKEPKNFQVFFISYSSIGYYQGKAIVKDENGSFYFVNCEKKMSFRLEHLQKVIY